MIAIQEQNGLTDCGHDAALNEHRNWRQVQLGSVGPGMWSIALMSIFPEHSWTRQVAYDCKVGAGMQLTVCAGLWSDTQQDAAAKIAHQEMLLFQTCPL